MSEIITDSLAQIKTDSTGLFIDSAVVSGIAFFENPGQIFRGDADPGIPDTKSFWPFHGDGNAAAACVFDCIGQQLFDDKRKPLFIRQCRFQNRLIAEPNLLADKRAGKFLDRVPDDAERQVPSPHIVQFAAAPPTAVLQWENPRFAM